MELHKLDELGPALDELGPELAVWVSMVLRMSITAKATSASCPWYGSMGGASGPAAASAGAAGSTAAAGHDMPYLFQIG